MLLMLLLLEMSMAECKVSRTSWGKLSVAAVIAYTRASDCLSILACVASGQRGAHRWKIFSGPPKNEKVSTFQAQRK